MECPPPANASRHEEFGDEDDPYWSNQGESGTCARHALAKGIYREISGYTKNHVTCRISNLVTMLLTTNQAPGGGGAAVTAWNDLVGSFADLRGRVYDISFRVREVPLREGQRGVHIACIDLHHIWRQYPPRSLHAMFVLYADGHSLTLKNSWGNENQKVKLDFDQFARDPYAKGYYLQVRHLVRRDFINGRNYEIRLAGDGQWFCLCCRRGRSNGGLMCKKDACGWNQCQASTNGVRCVNPIGYEPFGDPRGEVRCHRHR
jgi:hypothetical protein